jgi:hypothetical protein
MSGEVRFIDCSVCGVEHVDYLLCGGSFSGGYRESIFERAAKNFFRSHAEKKKGFDFVGALAKEFKAMYLRGQSSAP